MVVQIDRQGVHGAQPHRVADFLGRIGQHHAQLGAIGRQLEPLATHRQHLRVEFDGRGAQAQFLVAELGDGPGPQPQLHGVALGDTGGLNKQQPGHHALHILQLDLERLGHTHRALDPRGSQVQVAHLAIVGDTHFG